jgi:hypothetical protein
MPGKLKPLDVERETRPGKYPDGDGLYLVVASPTSKNWSYRYWKDSSQDQMSSASTKRVNRSSTTQPSPKTEPHGFWFCATPYKKEIEAVDRKEREVVRPAIRKMRSVP